MKALSIRQPYAELIVNGQKTIELRSWNTKHRGVFLIHTSKYKPTITELELFGLDIDNLGFGAIIGSAKLIDVKNYDDYPSEEWNKDINKHLAGVDYKFSTKGFVLKNPQKFSKSIPYKGQLHFFNAPDNIHTTFDIPSQTIT